MRTSSAPYVVDIDIPGDTLRLTPLPKRPEDTAVTASLGSNPDGESEEAEPQVGAKNEKTTEKSAADKSQALSPAPRIPKDRYVAPEMAQWARIYRIGHSLLMPTHVNDSKAMLFILDTGAFSNMMSDACGAHGNQGQLRRNG